MQMDCYYKKPLTLYARLCVRHIIMTIIAESVDNVPHGELRTF